MPKSNNQGQGSASAVLEMDARQLLRTINSGAASQIKIFSEKVKRIGKDHGYNWELVTLNPNSLVFEDTDNNTLYQASIQRLNRGKIKLDDFKEIRVVESKKKDLFTKACHDLVVAIAEEDQRGQESSFNKVARHHFRSSVIPSSGWVTTRDGIARNVRVQNEIVSDDVKPFIIQAICEALADKVYVSKGQIVEAVFSDSDERVKIAITELTRRKVIARHMREAAEKAYLSEGFQSWVHDIAGHVSNSKFEQAATLARKFLTENQEFCLLNSEQTEELIGNALATYGCLNQKLAKDTSLLMCRVNYKFNKATIIESWKKTAQRSEYAPLVENVRLLEESKDFGKSYDKFLEMFFAEGVSTKSARAQSYLLSLKELRKVLEGTDEEALVSHIDDYIIRLEQDPENVDDATLYEIEDVLASISQKLIQDVKSLADFDEIPEPPGAEEAEKFGEKDLSGEAGGGMAASAVALPLGDTGEGEEDVEAGEGEEELELTPEVGAEAGPGGGEEEPMMMAADVNKTGKPIAERASTIVGKNKAKAISDMDVNDLHIELTEWREKGQGFFVEDGYDVCVEHLRHYIDQAIELGDQESVEGFEKVLSSNLLEEQGETRDPYEYNEDEAGVGINLEYGYGPEGEGRRVCTECGAECSETDITESGGTCHECGAAMAEITSEEAVGMDSPTGEGVAAKKATESDGRSSKGGGKGGGGKTDAPEQPGKGVAGDVEGEVDGTNEATGEYGGTGLEMGGQHGKGVVGKGTKGVSGTDSSSTPGSGGAGGQKMDDRGGKGVVARGTKKVSGDDSSGSPGSGGAGGQKMDDRGGKGVVAKGVSKSDGKSHSGSAPTGKPTLGEEAEIAEAHKCDCPKTGGCKDNKDCKCPDSCPCKSGEMEEAQYKHGTKRRPRGFARSELASEGVEAGQAIDEQIDDAISQIADAMPVQDGVEEGKLPPHLEKYKKKKKGEEGKSDEGKGDDEEGHNPCGTCGKNPCECSESYESTASDEDVAEDKNITQPGSAKYDTEADARKDGDGKKRRPLPKFSDTDYDGTSGAKTADKKSGGYGS